MGSTPPPALGASLVPNGLLRWQLHAPRLHPRSYSAGLSGDSVHSTPDLPGLPKQSASTPGSESPRHGDLLGGGRRPSAPKNLMRKGCPRTGPLGCPPSPAPLTRLLGCGTPGPGLATATARTPRHPCCRWGSGVPGPTSAAGGAGGAAGRGGGARAPSTPTLPAPRARAARASAPALRGPVGAPRTPRPGRPAPARVASRLRGRPAPRRVSEQPAGWSTEATPAAPGPGSAARGLRQSGLPAARSEPARRRRPGRGRRRDAAVRRTCGEVRMTHRAA